MHSTQVPILHSSSPPNTEADGIGNATPMPTPSSNAAYRRVAPRICTSALLLPRGSDTLPWLIGSLLTDKKLPPVWLQRHRAGVACTAASANAVVSQLLDAQVELSRRAVNAMRHPIRDEIQINDWGKAIGSASSFLKGAVFIITERGVGQEYIGACGTLRLPDGGLTEWTKNFHGYIGRSKDAESAEGFFIRCASTAGKESIDNRYRIVGPDEDPTMIKHIFKPRDKHVYPAQHLVHQAPVLLCASGFDMRPSDKRGMRGVDDRRHDAMTCRVILACDDTASRKELSIAMTAAANMAAMTAAGLYAMPVRVNGGLGRVRERLIVALNRHGTAHLNQEDVSLADIGLVSCGADIFSNNNILSCSTDSITITQTERVSGTTHPLKITEGHSATQDDAKVTALRNYRRKLVGSWALICLLNTPIAAKRHVV